MSDDELEHEMSDEEVDALVKAALENLLNIAALAAELQQDDDSCEEIYAQCDLVAAYHGIERQAMTVEENPDGSYTTRFADADQDPPAARTRVIPGHIRTRGKPKLRIQDRNDPRSKK